MSVCLACAPFGVEKDDAGVVVAPGEPIGLGDGRDGTPTLASGARVNEYFSVSGPIATGATRVRVGSKPLPRAGEVVILWQMAGTAVIPSNDEPRMTLTEADGAGRYELAKIASIDGDDVVLDRATTGAYANPVQLVTVPRYVDVVIAGGTVVTGRAFDGATGGIVAFLATGAVTVDGAVDASGLGFEGGAGKVANRHVNCTDRRGKRDDGFAFTGQGVSGGGDPIAGFGNIANGGGGGDCHNAGGGGGGHGGSGGRGGNTPDAEMPGNRSVGGIGGAAIDYDPATRLVMGGGGGAGEENDSLEVGGARGGGVVFVRAKTFAGRGTVSASGSTAPANTKDGAGGGGAGGLVFVTADAIACWSVVAKGGDGGKVGTGGPGGGGGGGVVRLTTTPTACKVDVTSGANGTAESGAGFPDRGATDGAAGRGP